MCGTHAVQKDVRAGNVADTHTDFLYDQFRSFCATFQIEHWIYDPALPVAEILQMYGYWVRHGHWSNIPEVRADSVSTAWRAIAAVHIFMDALTPENHAVPPAATLTSASSTSSAHNPFRTPPSVAKILSPLASSWLPPRAQAPDLSISA